MIAKDVENATDLIAFYAINTLARGINAIKKSGTFASYPIYCLPSPEKFLLSRDPRRFDDFGPAWNFTCDKRCVCF
jgi:hypothetical protein